MAMTKEEREDLKRNLQELSANSGGSLVKRIKKMSFSGNEAVLFVGLGGLGCKTVNQIKKIYRTEFDNTNKIAFIAVDTAKNDIDGITVGADNGYMEPSECMEIYDDGAKKLLINPPTEVRSWLGDIEPYELDKDGANARRQIGRIMLCGTDKYSQLKTKIKAKVDALEKVCADGTVHVVLVAGISGGTGSGTFIDVSYMIKDVLSSCSVLNKMWGCFYTPNVQKYLKDEVGGEKWLSLKRNGYASLKELDYFMTNGSEAENAPTIYSLVAPGGTTCSSSKSIYDRNRVFVVSKDAKNEAEKNQIIDSAARSLMEMLRDVTSAGELISILSVFSNTAGEGGDLEVWDRNKIGAPFNGKDKDYMGIKDTNYPVFMNYMYSTFGYNSIYFPRDEMMAYCANAVYTKVIEKWTDINNLNQDNVASFAHDHNIATIEEIVGSIKATMKAMGYREDSLKIDDVKHANYWPKVIGGGLLGKVSGTSNTIQCAHMLAEEKFNEFYTSDAYEKMVGALADGVIEELNSAKFMKENGPFCGIACLTGISGKNIVGCCGNLETLLTGLGQAQTEIEDHLEMAKVAMENEAKRLEDDHNPSKDEIATFIDKCYEYSKALIENGIYNQIIRPVIEGVHERLINYNNETFAIFVPVIEALDEMLNEDATIMASTEHTYSEHTHHFSMDAYGIAESREKREQFKKVLGACIEDKETDQVAQKFADSMFNGDSREKWKQFKDNPKALADEIRSIFVDFFKPFASSLLEKLMVLAYNEDDKLDVDIEKLSTIWGAADGTPEATIRDSAISRAAKKIVLELKQEGALMASFESGPQLFSDLLLTRTVMLLNDTPKLNQAIISEFDDPRLKVGYIDDEHKSIIFSISFANPIALPLLSGMKEYAQEYYKLATAGRHLDEKGQNWVEYLPELFGIDAENYYVDTMKREAFRIDYPYGTDGKPFNNDENVYKKIMEAFEYGVKMGYISKYTDEAGAPKGYQIIDIEWVKDNYNTVYSEYQKILDTHEDEEGKTWKDALERAKVAGTVRYKFVKLSCDNKPLNDLILAEPEIASELKNVYRVIRSNMGLIKTVIEAMEKYSVLFERLYNMKLYSERLDTFADMVKCDVLKNDTTSKKWSYIYSATSPAVEFFDYNASQKPLDLASNIYHAFVKFCTEVNDEMYKLVRKHVDELNDAGKRNLQVRDAFVAQVEAAKVDPLFIKLPESERYADINKGRNESRYRELYDMPVKYDGNTSVYNNVVNFYEKLIEKLAGN